MKRICVFCGSKAGNGEHYRDAAAALGRRLAANGQTLVFGGGSVGLMGVIADAVLAAAGEVIGVIPRALATKELEHPRVVDMRRVADMHARKALMAELADGFIALPGGFGTLEELFEVITWTQLGFQKKSIGLLNTAGYFELLQQFLDHAIGSGFIDPLHRDLFVVDDCPDRLLDRMAAHRLPQVRQWLGPDEI